jgi:hypothetical protein
MGRRTLFFTVFLTVLLVEGAILLSGGVPVWSRLFLLTLLVTCIGGGWIGGRDGRVLRPLLPVWTGAFAATFIAMAIFVVTGAALEAGFGPAPVWATLLMSVVYPPALALAGAGAAALARALTRRAPWTPAR